MNRKVPVAIFTYNRPKHTGRLLASIERNARGEEIDIWIFSDAPKQASHAPAVEETRALVRRWAAGIGATVRERDRNLGIARSIVGATSELVVAGGSVLAFCPRDGGSEELSGVFGGWPSLASSSAMRAFNALTCASNSSMRTSSDATRRALSVLGESIFLRAMTSVNQLAALGSTRQTRVTTPQRGE
jgi:hypothetical protein